MTNAIVKHELPDEQASSHTRRLSAAKSKLAHRCTTWMVGAAGMVAASLGGIATAQGQVTWQVQSDYFGERNAIAQPRTIRGMALSADEASVYTGLIQSPNTGSTSLRKVSAGILAVPGTDHVIFGNGMPGGTGTFGQVGGQPVYAGGGTGTFQGWIDVGNSPEGIDTDDRGNVYVALQSGISNASRIDIFNADLTAQVSSVTPPSPTGVSVRRFGNSYYLYSASASGLQRWNATSFPPTLDLSWIPTPFVAGARNLTVDSDGTVFAAGNNQVTRLDPDGTVTHTVTVTNAADVAVFQNKIYVIKRQSPTQPIVVLNKADLTSAGPDLVVPALGGTRGDLSQFTSIDVSHDGRLYVSEENYTGATSGSNSGAVTTYVPPVTSFNPTPGTITGRIYFDRVLASSPLADEVAPEVTCPPDIDVDAPPGQPTANVDPGMATAFDDVDGDVSASVMGTRSDNLALNDPYPVGTTIITWTASDSANNVGQCEQIIMVTAVNAPGPRAIKQAVLSQLQSLSPLPVKKDDDKLKAAINGVAKSLLSQYWIDDSHLVESTGTKVFDGEKEAAKKLRELRDSNQSGLTPAQLNPLINDLVGADRTLATTAISDAIAANGNAAKINKAQAALAKGDQKAAQGKPDEAITEYKNAWKEAVGAY